MEAPEKIYVDSKAIGDNISTTVHTKRQDYPTSTEYIRTDAFIEKACELLANCIEDFMARRMEIWGEVCKKQTLENLRNALKE